MEIAEFYSKLKPFRNFERLSTNEVYKPAPSEWFVVIADVEGSTKAIAEGRYKDVNLVGAAAISSVQSCFPGEEIAFVFGGDGAAFLLGPEKIEAAKAALASLKSASRAKFGMSIRIGVVAVSEIIAAGQTIEVAKFEIARGRCSLLVRGGGLAWAEHRIKKFDRQYGVAATAPEGAADPFAGLSCRWKPIAPERAMMLAILVQPRAFDSARMLNRLLGRFSDLFGGRLENGSPIGHDRMRYGGFWRSLLTEFRLASSARSFAGRAFELALCVWAFRWRLPVPFAAAAYVADIPSHTDYRKYDDTLRMVLDCSRAQADAIRAELQSLLEAGEIFFGLHESSHALMTCLVENLREGGHVHFVDGSDGGYAMAARELKAQMAAAEAGGVLGAAAV